MGPRTLEVWHITGGKNDNTGTSGQKGFPGKGNNAAESRRHQEMREAEHEMDGSIKKPQAESVGAG